MYFSNVPMPALSDSRVTPQQDGMGPVAFATTSIAVMLTLALCAFAAVYFSGSDIPTLATFVGK